MSDEYQAHPELHGTFFRRKGGNGTSWQFSRTVLDMAGGLERLLSEWERVSID